MVRSFFILLFSFALVFVAEAKVKIVDGDSLEIDGRRIRLEGVDAPEYGQFCENENGQKYDCGKKSKEFLIDLLKNKELVCNKIKKDRYKRDLSICYVGRVNVNQAMVASGWAVSYDFDGKGFAKEEKEAREKKLGLWCGKFMKPELYRRLYRDD